MVSTRHSKTPYSCLLHPAGTRDEIRTEAEAMPAHYSRSVDQKKNLLQPFGKKIKDR